MAGQVTRQQRRKVQREALQRADRLLLKGLPEELDEVDAVAVVLALAQVLTQDERPDRASALADRAEALLSRTIAGRTRKLPVACARGCFYCCRCQVTCTPPEIFNVVTWIAAEPERGALLGPLVAAEAKRRQPISQQDLARERPLCPLNRDGACGVYPARPLPCRALLSLSGEACRIGIERGEGQIPIVTTALDAAEVVRTMMLAAVRSVGLPDAGYELTTAVAAMLAIPDAEQRWLAGEDVFAGLPRMPRPPDGRALEDRLAAQARLLLE